MTNAILLGLLIGIIGSLPFDLGQRGFAKKWALLTLGQTLLWTTILLLIPMNFVGHLGGPHLIFMVTVAIFLNVFLCLILDGIENGRKEYHIPYTYIRTSRSVIATVLSFCILLSFTFIPSCGAFNHEKMRAFVNDHVNTTSAWTDSFSAIDPAHIRTVPLAYARWKGNKILGQSSDSLGSRYEIGDYTIQKYQDELVWVAPLEFSGFWRWRKAQTSPAYILISAENPADPGKVVEGLQMAYMESAYFGHDLERHVYSQGYQFRGVTDFTFEIDDGGHPWFTATLYTPTIFWSGDRVDGILLVDPETGKVEEKIGEDVPSWVDREVPCSLAISRLTWWGEYVHGFWNGLPFGANLDVNVPTSDTMRKRDVQLVWDAQGNATWFTGFTSVQSTDQSLVGIALMDSRTGFTHYYPASGPDEQGVIRAVNAAVSNFQGYRGVEPIPYNIYGELTWVVPVLSQDGIIQKIAIVRGSNGMVALGADKHAALAEYRKMLQDSGSVIDPSPTGEDQIATGTIHRISPVVVNGETVFYLTLNDEDRTIFTGTVSVSPELAISREGEQVLISFTQTQDSVVTMTDFDLLSFLAKDSSGEK